MVMEPIDKDKGYAAVEKAIQVLQQAKTGKKDDPACLACPTPGMAGRFNALSHLFAAKHGIISPPIIDDPIYYPK